MGEPRHWALRTALAALALALTFATAARVAAAERPEATANLWQPGDPGERLEIRGRVLSAGGQPASGAVLELWQRDGTGVYRDDRYRARLQTGDDGWFQISTVLPAQGFGARHIHVVVTHPTHRRLATAVLFQGDPNLEQAMLEGIPIALERVQTDTEMYLLGGVEFVLQPN